MAMSDKIRWTPAAEKQFSELKAELMASTVLSLPDYSKPFTQTVDCRDGFMPSVLLQTHEGKMKPIGFFSKRLDPVARALPPCVQAVCAATIAVEATAEIVLYHPMTLLVPHAVDLLLLLTRMTFLSPARHLSCTALLLSQPHITIKRCTVLNPATLLPNENERETHNCVEQTEQLQLPRADLTDVPLDKGDMWYVDGSCYKSERGKTMTGYAVVQLPNMVIEVKKIKTKASTQAAEIIALT